MSDEQRPWPTLNPLRRWGPIALVLVVFVALAVVATPPSPSGTTEE